MTNADVLARFDICWDGRKVPPVVVTDQAPVPVAEALRTVRRDISRERAAVLECLEERATWSTKKLSLASGVVDTKFWAVLQSLERHGLVTRPARGWIARARMASAGRSSCG